ncbi:unnamed protein product [Orchesella dallaii]|uniref:Reverse transcriptase RNase H-like domain-containing protein n=1 Tax=Orchesella dallaii TaxID=48710 RepID=A0ABP1RBG3_9HEXA
MVDYMVLSFVIIAALVVAALVFWLCYRKLNELWKERTRSTLEAPVSPQESLPRDDYFPRRNAVQDYRRHDSNLPYIFPNQFRDDLMIPNSSNVANFQAPYTFSHQFIDPIPRRGNAVIDTSNRRNHFREPQPPPVLPVSSLYYENERRLPSSTNPPSTSHIGYIQDSVLNPTEPKLKPKSQKKKPQKTVGQQQSEHDVIARYQITSFQENLRSDENQHETVQKVQRLLLSLGKCDEDDGTQCSLIIGVDATPVTQAGYCVNLVDKSLQYYVIKRQDLPWVLHDEKDPAEFEMKNLMFALTVWQMKILKFKRIRVYTDNFAVTKPDDKYGGRAKRYLDHFAKCEKITILNRGSLAVNRFKNLKYFAKYIQPADDLSRWHINEAVEFLTSLYDIDKENVLGTHQQHLKRKHPSSSVTTTSTSVPKTWYNPTENYKHFLDLANMVIECHQCGNTACSSILTSSLRIKTK